jgi:hypothetical protein
MAEATTYANGGPTDIVAPNHSPERKPISPSQFESFRPKAVVADVDAAAPRVAGSTQDELFQLLGTGAGLPRSAATRLTAVIFSLSERIAALEKAQQPVALAGVEKR